MKAIFTGSFNPFHHGHLYVYNTACKMFGEENVWIGIGKNPNKPDRDFERLKFSLLPITKNVIVFETLCGDVCKEQDFDFIVRGVKGGNSLEQEEIQAYWNYKLSNKTQTILIPTPPEVAMISSSVIRELDSYKADEESISGCMDLDVYYRWKNGAPRKTIYFGRSCSGKSTYLGRNVLNVDKAIWDFVDDKIDKEFIKEQLVHQFKNTMIAFNMTIRNLSRHIDWKGLFAQSDNIDFPVIGTYFNLIPKYILAQCRLVKISTSGERREEFIKSRNVSKKFIECADHFYKDPPYWDDEVVIK